ncbi:hypothetical protein ACXZ66_02440 [Corynebacterium sp. S7]
MGRILLIILIIVAIWLLWRAFGPGSSKRLDSTSAPQQPPAIKGPDDDEEFLWNIEKNRFKERRAKEEADRRAKEEEERQRKFREGQSGPDEQPN